MSTFAVTQLRMSREYGGAERYVVELSTRLQERGYRVNIITSPDSPLSLREEDIPVPVHKAPIQGDINFAASFWLAYQLRRNEVRLLNVHDGTLPCSLGAHMAGIPVIATVHGFRKKWYFLAADHLIAVSDAVGQHLRNLGFPGDRVSVIRNGVDTRWFTVQDSGAARLKLGLQPDQFNFIATSRLIKKKGIDLLLDAFTGVVERVPHARLLIAGAGSEAAALQEQATRLQLGDTVRFFGFVKDIRPLLAAADCHVLPSLVEPLGLAELEAMACGKPSLATDSGGPREVILDRQTGMILPVGDVAALREAMLFAAQNPQWVCEAGQAARRHVEELHSLDRQVDAIEAVYARLLPSS